MSQTKLGLTGTPSSKPVAASPPPTGNLTKIKVAGTFRTVATKVKIGGTFVPAS